MDKKDYDFVFIVGGLPYTSYPSGGENIIFQLCSRLKSDGCKVGIVVIKNPREYLYSIKKDPKILSVFPGKHPKIRSVISSAAFNKLGGGLRKISKVDYDFKILKGVDILFINAPKDIKVKVKRIIATAWSTADFTSEYVRSHSEAKGYYLVQNSEDNLNFSGELNKYAAETYDIKNLRKLVINNGMYERFRSESPLLFNVGIDYNEFYYNGPKEKSIMFPLRTNGSKGAQYILDAVNKLQTELKAWKFVAFGDYPQGKVPGYIEFHYKASTASLKKMYAESKIFVLPSLVEGFPLTVLEAMSSHCAVISTDCGGTNEYIVDGENALFVPIKDSVGLEKKVLDLSADEQSIEKLAENGQITAKRYSYENMYKQFIRLFS